MVGGVPVADAAGWHRMAAEFASGDLVESGWKGSWSARRPFFYIGMGSFYGLFGATVTVARTVHPCFRPWLQASSSMLSAAWPLFPSPCARRCYTHSLSMTPGPA